MRNSRITRGPIRAAIALCGAGLMAVAAIPGSASAGTYLQVCWRNPDSNDARNGGCANFIPDNDVLKIIDWQADGWGTRAQIWKRIDGVWYTHSHVCFDDTNTSNADGGYTVCNYDLKEGRPILVHIWASNDGVFQHHEYSAVGTA